MDIEHDASVELVDASVLERLGALKTLFSIWVKSGVPVGIKYPKSMTAARTWTCPEHGIHSHVGSKREYNTKHPRYGETVAEIGELVTKLQPLIVQKKRKVETTKAKSERLDSLMVSYKAMLEGVTKQNGELDDALVKTTNALGVEKVRSEGLQRKVDALEDEVAALKRELANLGGKLRVVN